MKTALVVGGTGPSGTSYAVATAAGVAALWLSFHGRDNLIARYGSADALPAVFREILLTVGCDPGVGLDDDEYGAGIVNAKKVLEAALPPSAPARGMRAVRMRAVSDDLGGFETLVHLYARTSGTELRRVLCDLLNVTEKDLTARLSEAGEELSFYLATDPTLRAMVTTAVGKARRRASLPGASTETVPDLQRVLASKGVSQRLLMALMGN